MRIALEMDPFNAKTLLHFARDLGVGDWAIESGRHMSFPRFISEPMNERRAHGRFRELKRKAIRRFASVTGGEARGCFRFDDCTVRLISARKL